VAQLASRVERVEVSPGVVQDMALAVVVRPDIQEMGAAAVHRAALSASGQLQRLVVAAEAVAAVAHVAQVMPMPVWVPAAAVSVSSLREQMALPEAMSM
jgi:hypothetical protein